MKLHRYVYGTSQNESYSDIGKSHGLANFLKDKGSAHNQSTLNTIKKYIPDFVVLKDYGRHPKKEKPLVVGYVPLCLSSIEGMPANMKDFSALAVSGPENRGNVGEWDTERAEGRETKYRQIDMFSTEELYQNENYNHLDYLFGISPLTDDQIEGIRENTLSLDENIRFCKVAPNMRIWDKNHILWAAYALLHEQPVVLHLEPGVLFNQRAREVLMQIYSMLPAKFASRIGYVTYQSQDNIHTLLVNVGIKVIVIPGEEPLDVQEGKFKVLDFSQKLQSENDDLWKTLEAWYEMPWEERVQETRSFNLGRISPAKDFVHNSIKYQDAKKKFDVWKKSQIPNSICTIKELWAVYKEFDAWDRIPNGDKVFAQMLPEQMAENCSLASLASEAYFHSKYAENETERQNNKELFQFATKFIPIDSDKLDELYRDHESKAIENKTAVVQTQLESVQGELDQKKTELDSKKNELKEANSTIEEQKESIHILEGIKTAKINIEGKLREHLGILKNHLQEVDFSADACEEIQASDDFDQNQIEAEKLLDQVKKACETVINQSGQIKKLKEQARTVEEKENAFEQKKKKIATDLEDVLGQLHNLQPKEQEYPTSNGESGSDNSNVKKDDNNRLNGKFSALINKITDLIVFWKRKTEQNDEISGGSEYQTHSADDEIESQVEPSTDQRIDDLLKKIEKFVSNLTLATPAKTTPNAPTEDDGKSDSRKVQESAKDNKSEGANKKDKPHGEIKGIIKKYWYIPLSIVVIFLVWNLISSKNKSGNEDEPWGTVPSIGIEEITTDPATDPTEVITESTTENLTEELTTEPSAAESTTVGTEADLWMFEGWTDPNLAEKIETNIDGGSKVLVNEKLDAYNIEIPKGYEVLAILEHDQMEEYPPDELRNCVLVVGISGSDVSQSNDLFDKEEETLSGVGGFGFAEDSVSNTDETNESEPLEDYTEEWSNEAEPVSENHTAEHLSTEEWFNLSDEIGLVLETDEVIFLSMGTCEVHNMAFRVAAWSAENRHTPMQATLRLADGDLLDLSDRIQKLIPDGYDTDLWWLYSASIHDDRNYMRELMKFSNSHLVPVFSLRYGDKEIVFYDYDGNDRAAERLANLMKDETLADAEDGIVAILLPQEDSTNNHNNIGTEAF